MASIVSDVETDIRLLVDPKILKKKKEEKEVKAPLIQTKGVSNISVKTPTQRSISVAMTGSNPIYSTKFLKKKMD